MTYWSTKTSSRAGELVVIKHTVPGINFSIKGARFRDGFAVVEKNSKLYHELKKIPQLKNAPEYDLLYLGKLRFVTRSKDIEMVYGKDVYTRYLQALEYSKTEEYKVQKQEEAKVKAEEESKHIQDPERCSYRLDNGELCKHKAFEHSPSGYCNIHLLEDEKLSGLGIQVPKYMPRSEKKQLRLKVMKQLEKMFKGSKKSEETLEAANGTS